MVDCHVLETLLLAGVWSAVRQLSKALKDQTKPGGKYEDRLRSDQT